MIKEVPFQVGDMATVDPRQKNATLTVTKVTSIIEEHPAKEHARRQALFSLLCKMDDEINATRHNKILLNDDPDA